MWYETRDWTSLISDYVACACGGIRTIAGNCPACGDGPFDLRPTIHEGPQGERFEIYPVFAGAEGRREDYQLLALMEREWRRPPSKDAKPTWLTSGMSERAAVVILFWTYFESRMNRLVWLGLNQLPKNVQNDLSSRYDSVSSHMKQLYQILFGVKYIDDLKDVGAEPIGGHLARMRDVRNRFVHGDPDAISDDVVASVVSNLKAEHEAWIAVYNRRISISLEVSGKL